MSSVSSDARASPVPLGPVAEEGDSAPTVGAEPVSAMYDDGSYIRSPPHGSGFNNVPAATYYCQPPHQHQWQPTPVAMPYSPQQPYIPYHSAMPHQAPPTPYYVPTPHGHEQDQQYTYVYPGPPVPPVWNVNALSPGAAHRAPPTRDDLLFERIERIEARLRNQPHTATATPLPTAPVSTPACPPSPARSPESDAIAHALTAVLDRLARLETAALAPRRDGSSPAAPSSPPPPPRPASEPGESPSACGPLPTTSSPSAVPHTPPPPSEAYDDEDDARLPPRRRQTRVSWGDEPPSPRPPPPPLPSATLKALKTDIEPKRVMQWLKRFQARCVQHEPALSPIFLASDDEWRRLLNSHAHADISQLDQWVATQILDCLDGASTRVSNLLDASPPELFTSGRALLNRLVSSYFVKTGAELRAAEHAFAELQPFRLGMDTADVEFAARDAINSFKRLPAFNPHDALALHKMLLEKLPDSIAARREEAISKLHEEAIKGRTEWTLDQLIFSISLWLRPAPRSQLTAAAAAVLVSDACTGVVNEQLEADAEACAATRPKSKQRDGCFVCGKLGCSVRSCKLSCATCGEKLCPGARPPNPCVVAAAARPERNNIRNALGTIVSQNVHEHLVGKWDERRQRRSARAHSASAGTGDLDVELTEEEWVEAELAGASLGPLCSTALAPAIPGSAAVAARRPSSASAAVTAPAACTPLATPSAASQHALRVRFQIDGGSNANIISDAAAAALCTHAPTDGIIGGIAGGLPYVSEATANVRFKPSAERYALSFLHTPSGSKNILAESILLESFGIEARKRPARLISPAGDVATMHCEDGLYFADLYFYPWQPEPAAASATMRASDVALLWAARLGTDANGLLHTSKAVHGVGVDNLSLDQRAVINSSIPRAIAQARHAPTRGTPPRNLATCPAETFVCDGFGPHAAPSPIDGATYQFEAVCEATSYAYIATCRTHTVRDMVDFLRSVTLHARSLGHQPIRVRLDRAPEFRAADFRVQCERDLGLLVQLTSREHHQGVGRCERHHDILTRAAEAMLQRAGLGTAWLLPAREYANHLDNRAVHTAGGVTKWQRFHGSVPSFASTTPYIFGTTVVAVEDVRGPKGSLDHPRGSVGRFVGIRGSSYLVFRENRLGTVAQHHIRPLNELALVRHSLPPAVATVDTGVQTLHDAAPQPKPAPPERARPAPPPVVDLPIGTRLEVLWFTKGGAIPPAWYAGRIVDSHTYASGRRRHFVAYDGFPDDVHGHDLASSDFEWRRLDSAEPAAPARAVQPAAQPRLGPVTRARRAAVAFACSASALESSRATEHAAVFDSAIYQVLGSAAEGYFCDAHTSLDSARLALLGDAHGLLPSCSGPLSVVPPSPTCLKATQNVVDVTTPTGVHQYTVPATAREVAASPQRDFWLAADEKGMHALLSWTGNRLVPVSVPAAAGLPIVPCVTQRKIKIDPATGGLDSRNAFKSRHCVDGGRQRQLLETHGVQVGHVETSASVADDLAIKLTLADAALHDRDTAKADVPNAYLHGERQQRPVTYMAMPTTLAHLRTDDGAAQCLELAVPVWGEEPAGFEWSLARNAAFRDAGWRQAENVGDMWTFTAPDGLCRMLVIVDDLYFSEDSSLNRRASRALCAILSERYGDVRYELEPSSFKGYSIRRDRDARLLQLTMPQKIDEAARAHLPQLLDGGELPRLPAGRRLAEIADGLALVTPASAKLNSQQVRTQQLIGSLKFIEQLHPRLSLILHRLSCIMSSPPAEAYSVALAALVAVHAEKHIGITYGGAGMSASPRIDAHLAANIDLSQPAPSDLVAHADSTWGDRNVYGLILTYAGGAVLHQTKKISLIVDSSMEAEAVASGRAAEHVTYSREILRALGTPVTDPTLVGTDNLANMRVGSTAGCPSRSRHFLRRYHVLLQRVAAGEVILRHVPSAQMAADFLTKWLPKPKVDASLRYVCNSWIHTA